MKLNFLFASPCHDKIKILWLSGIRSSILVFSLLLAISSYLLIMSIIPLRYWMTKSCHLLLTTASASHYKDQTCLIGVLHPKPLERNMLSVFPPEIRDSYGTDLTRKYLRKLSICELTDFLAHKAAGESKPTLSSAWAWARNAMKGKTICSLAQETWEPTIDLSFLQLLFCLLIWSFSNT